MYLAPSALIRIFGLHFVLKVHFRPKDSASKRCTVLASDSGQSYAGEWTKCLKVNNDRIIIFDSLGLPVLFIDSTKDYKGFL